MGRVGVRENGFGGFIIGGGTTAMPVRIKE
jgi:hypothetical protein